MTKLNSQTVTRPARISISYAALVALITEAVLFVQDVAIHKQWVERDTLFVIAVVVGIITLVGPFLPVPVAFDDAGTATPLALSTGTLQATSAADVPASPVSTQAAPTAAAAPTQPEVVPAFQHG